MATYRKMDDWHVSEHELYHSAGHIAYIPEAWLRKCGWNGGERVYKNTDVVARVNGVSAASVAEAESRRIVSFSGYSIARLAGVA